MTGKACWIEKDTHTNKACRLANGTWRETASEDLRVINDGTSNHVLAKLSSPLQLYQALVPFRCRLAVHS